MTTAEIIQPALTREEWGHREMEFGEEGWIAIEGCFPVSGSGEPLLVCDTAYVGTYNKSGRASQKGIRLDLRGRHAMAAVALCGHPFGFTRDDVTRIREAAQTMQWSAVWMGEDDKSPAAMLRALADRIAALLPPE